MAEEMEAHEILELLQDHDADLSQARELSFYFYGIESNLGPFHTALEKLGFAVRPTQGVSGRIATVVAVLTEDWLREQMAEIIALSAKYGVEYDGWEAALHQPCII